MASTSNIHNSSVGVVNQAGNVQIENFNMNVNNPQPEINESEFDLPRLIDTFHGREQEFNTLEKLFFNQKKNKIVVHGLPGYGKTELCKQFAQWCFKKTRVERVFWINAENIDELNKLSESLKNIYKKYKNRRCMYLFDNALNRRSICDYEPTNNDKYKILITSHVKDWGYGVVPLPLDPLTSEPVTQIFKTILEENYQEEDYTLYVELGQTVDNVPLGVQIVAGYVRQRIQRLGQSFHLIDCVEEMKLSKHQIINDTFYKDNPNPYKNSIYGALTVSINKIKEEEDIQRRELAITVLCVCAFLDPQRIYCSDLVEIPTIKEFIGYKNSEIELKSAIRLLVNFSFVNYRDTDESAINIHKFVQTFLRQYLNSRELEDKKCYIACVYAMFNYFLSVLEYGDVSTKQQCVEFLKTVFQYLNGSGTDIIYEYDLFYKAAKWNKIEMLEIFLHHADINETNDNGHVVMYNVARSWNVEAVELLIARGIGLNHADTANRTLMDSLLSHLASYYTNYLPHNIMSTLAVLLARGVLFDKNLLSEKIKFKLLSSAVKMNNLDVLRSLVQNGLNVNSKGSTQWYNNNSILHEAVAEDNFECIQMHISHKAENIYECDLFYKAAKWNRIEVLKLLLQHADINETNYNGHGLICCVAQAWNVEAVELLIERGVDVNHRDAANRTPMDYLLSELAPNYNNYLSYNTMSTLAVLLARGASFDKNLLSEESVFWLLSSAARMNKLDMLKSLMQQGLNANSRGRFRGCGNNSVLHVAVTGGNFESIQLLISHGADPNVVSDDNETALCLFVFYVISNNRNIEKQELRNILRILNCKEYVQNKTYNISWTLLHLAAWRSHEELVTVLIETYNCEVNKQDIRGNTPLHVFIYGLNIYCNKEEAVQTVRTLIRCGASLSIQNHKQQTPLKLLKCRSKEWDYNLEYLVPLLTPTTGNCTIG